MSAPLLTFNAGSSTVKVGLFAVEAECAEGAKRIGRGVIDFRHAPLLLQLSNNRSVHNIPLKALVTDDLHDVLDETLNWFATHFSLTDFVSVGHRVVHGGDRFAGPVAITEDTLATIEALVPLAPLHQPQSLRLIRAIQHVRPHLVQSASFDTAFHRTQTDLVRRFALPRRFFDKGVKRYGFHGLSYQYISGALKRRFPELAAAKVIAAHLGSGASLCAMNAGSSWDSSMGFSTLDGIPMATRCGALDAGVVLHLLQQENLSAGEIEKILYERSGLLGVSGISADSRELAASARPEAQEALALFAFRIAGEASRLATTLDGLDCLVFTAGIGEHQPGVRTAVCKRLAWLGVELDEAANAANADVISTIGSRVTVLVLATDEEQVIADEAISILHAQGAKA